MAKIELSSKRLQISKANMYIITVVSVACFVSVFALAASWNLLGQRSYQAKVIAKKETAKKQLIANIQSRDKLVAQYKLFTNTQSNIISGSSTGSGDRDGDNAKIVLDALPSKYDFPALATSLEKLMTQGGLTISSITGTDDEINQSAAAAATPVEVPFTLSFDGTPEATKNFLSMLTRSIRPINVQQLTISGSDNKLTTSVTAKTYYQPEKSLNIKTEVVK